MAKVRVSIVVVVRGSGITRQDFVAEAGVQEPPHVIKGDLSDEQRRYSNLTWTSPIVDKGQWSDAVNELLTQIPENVWRVCDKYKLYRFVFVMITECASLGSLLEIDSGVVRSVAERGLAIKLDIYGGG
jgi:hypothetical protein